MSGGNRYRSAVADGPSRCKESTKHAENNGSCLSMVTQSQINRWLYHVLGGYDRCCEVKGRQQAEGDIARLTESRWTDCVAAENHVASCGKRTMEWHVALL